MPPKIKIISKPKKTLKEHFQEILQGSFPNIYKTITSEFSLDPTEKIIDTAKINNYKGKIVELFFAKDELLFLKQLDFDSFQYLYSRQCSINQLGKIPSAHIITNCSDCKDLLLFRVHNPVISNIFRSIYFYFNDLDFRKKLDEFKLWISENKKDKSFDKDILPFLNIEVLDQAILTRVYELLELVSEFDDINVVLYSQTLNKLFSSKGDIGPWYSHSNIITNIDKRRLSIIYLRNNGKKGVIFEPVNLINLDEKKIFNIVVKTNIFYDHIIDLIQKKDIQLVKKTMSRDIEMKLDKMANILFNPYDNNEELPTIEIETGTGGETKSGTTTETITGNKKFLLGYPYGKFRNIYNIDDKNKLEGKVKINISNTKLDVYWCQKS